MPQKDPVARRLYMREYKRRWKLDHQIDMAMSDRAVKANARAAKHGVSGRITIDDVRAVLACGVCHYCGEPGRIVPGTRNGGRAGLLTIDHRLSLHRGGSNDGSNLVAACFACNARKARADSPASWSTHHESCIDCGTTERRHGSHGRCQRCEQRERKRRRVA